MIQYKCWTCGNDMESPESIIGRTEICPKCKTPNLVPEPLENDSIEEEGKCFLCRERNADPESSVAVSCEKRITPFLHCQKCGETWEEPRFVQGTGKTIWYSPSCQSCGSDDVVPTQLPAMPVGKYIDNFRGRVTFKQTAEGIRSFSVSGQIDVPRCRECSKVNYRIVKISRGIGIGVWFVSGAIFSGIGMARGGILSAAYMMVFATFVIAPIAWAVSRVVLRRTIGRNIPHEKDALKFSPVQALAEQDWDVDIFPLT